jgi:outer membrane protein
MSIRNTSCMFLGRIAALFAVICFSFPAWSETLTLEQVIQEVCTKSDSVKMMKESVKKADEMVREKWSNALPVISASATGAKSHGSAFGGSSSGGSSRTMGSASAPKGQFASAPPAAPDPQYVTWQDLGALFDAFSKPQTSTIYGGGVSFNQPIYTFGKVGTAITVAKQFKESTVYSFKRNMQSLQLQAIDAFFLTMIADKAGAIAERSLWRKKELNGFLTSNFDLGSGSRSQVLLTRADALAQSTSALDAKKNAAVARMRLNAFMGRPLSDSLVLDTNGMPASLSGLQVPESDAAVMSALDERMDLKSLKALEDANKGGAKILRAMYLPSIGMQGSLGWSKMESGSAIMKNDGIWNKSIGVGLSWTLFDGFANSAKAAQYMSDAEKLEIIGSTIRKMVEIEIRSAIAECFAADSNVTASREFFIAAKEGYDITNSTFKQGSGQLSDLQRVDELLQNAELGLLNARYRQIRSRAALLVALGKDIVTIHQEERK